MADLTSIPGQSTTTIISSTIPTTASLPSSTSHIAAITSSAVLSSTYPTESYTSLELYSETTITNGVLPTSLYCVLHPSPLPPSGPDLELGPEAEGPSQAVGVTPVNDKSWPQILTCCGSQNITIYDYHGVCFAWCHANTTELNALFHCYFADPNQLLPEIEETICPDCPDETTTSVFHHSEVYSLMSRTASASATTTTTTTASTAMTASTASSSTASSTANRSRGLAGVITTIFANLALASFAML